MASDPPHVVGSLAAGGAPASVGVSSAATERTTAALAPATAAKSAAPAPTTLRRPIPSAIAVSLVPMSLLMIGAFFGFEFRPYRYLPVRVSTLVGRLAINCHATQTERAVRSVSGQTAKAPPVILPVVSKPNRRLGASPCRKKNFKTRRSNRRLSLVYRISARRATTPYSLGVRHSRGHPHRSPRARNQRNIASGRSARPRGRG